jgi:hypothetical protein
MFDIPTKYRLVHITKFPLTLWLGNNLPVSIIASEDLSLASARIQETKYRYAEISSIKRPLRSDDEWAISKRRTSHHLWNNFPDIGSSPPRRMLRELEWFSSWNRHNNLS